MQEDEYLVPNIVHLVVSSSDPPLTIGEAACLKSFLIHQQPGNDDLVLDVSVWFVHIWSDTVYVHTVILDLSSLGDNWRTLYNDKSLDLRSRLRVVMSRYPGELSILGQASVSEANAKLYWKFLVLKKYGGFYLERNILVQQNLNYLRCCNKSLIYSLN